MRRIFDVTVGELSRVGFDALSVPEVARKARVNKTSVYRRWATKDELVKAALGESLDHGRELPDAGSFADDLAELISRVAEFVESPRGAALLKLVFLEGNHRALRSLATSTWSEATGSGPEVVVTRAIARGELRPDADLELLLFTAAGAVLHRVLVERAPADAEWSARLSRLLLTGVGAAR